MKPQIPWLRVFVEGVVIVGSILLAFGIQAWWDGRQERASEVAVLAQLASALEGDLVVLAATYDTQRELHRNLVALIERLEGDEPLSDDLNFNAVTRWTTREANFGPYETLKSRGFDLISSDSLRLMLVEYYERVWSGLVNMNAFDQQFSTESVLPYYLTHFRQESSGGWVAPLDWEFVRDDEYYWNLCLTKLSRAEVRILPTLEDAIELGHSLLAAIESELGR